MTDASSFGSQGGTHDRRATILRAAGGVLLRYGYRKASVDAVAQAAGVSRQGVYLHFPTKETLFAATVEYLLDQSVSAAREALNAAGAPLEARIVNAFEAMGQDTLSQHLDEVLEAAERLTGRPPAELEGLIIAEFAAALEQSSGTSPWRRHGDGAEVVAVLLYATSAGLKRLASSTDDYVETMRVAVRLICSPNPRKRKKP